MNHSEKDDAVWQLLREARPVKAGPFFSRNVAREARQLKAKGAEHEGVIGTILSFFRQPVAAGAVAAAVVLAFVFLSTEMASHSTIVETAPVESAYDLEVTEEIESIGYLGELMAISDPAELDDAALADLSLLASR